MTTEGLSLAALADAAEEPVERVRRWVELGLLPAEEDGFGPAALDRARLVSFAARRGITAEAMAQVCEHDDIIGRFREHIAATETGPTRTLAEAAAAAGLDETTARRLWVASGLGEQTEAFDDDVEMLRALAFVLDSGMPIDALLQVLRVLNDALTRVAEAEVRLFHFYVHERLRSEGLTGSALEAARQQVGGPLRDLTEPAVLYFQRKAWRRALREDMVLHLAGDNGGLDEGVGRMTVAVLFVDLADFTPMTEAMGDSAAAAVIERFAELVREAAHEFDGRVLKQIGDEFMLVFSSATQAVSCGRSIMAKAAAEHQFPDVRLGAHAGVALYREGDYLGTTVNVAARVTSQAGRGQFLITEAVRGELDDAAVRSLGVRLLKGVSDEVALFEVATQRPARPVDPVCGMLIDPASCRVTLEWGGERVFFCSETCRDRFVADPGRYVQPADS